MIWKSKDWTWKWGEEKAELFPILINQAMSEMVSFKEKKVSSLNGKEKSTRELTHYVTGTYKLLGENFYLSSILFTDNMIHFTPVT